jgi:L-sorbose 1-phosphate reductase
MLCVLTKALRLYGKRDLRFEKFELPEMNEDEILAEVVTDSLCMSTYKAVNQGANHKKVPYDVDKNPIIVGHEFCGKILKVGAKWKDKYKEGSKFVIQPNLGIKNGLVSPGYSYMYIGGDATKIIIPNEVMENDCLIEYNGNSYFEGSLAEPLSCVIGAFNANFHLVSSKGYEHKMGIRENGNLALLGATGPMGFLAIDFALHNPVKPKNIIVTGITQSKIDLVRKLYTEEEAKCQGINLKYVNTSKIDNESEYLKEFTDDKIGFDDVFVFAPVKSLVESAIKMLKYDGCLNFFAGPEDKDFSAEVNFYNVHYNSAHIVGTSGGNIDDMRQALRLIENKNLNVSKIVTHILGINDAAETTLNLKNLSGGKKIVYTHKKFKLMNINEIKNVLQEKDSKLLELIEENDGLWNEDAEKYLIRTFEEI